MIYCCTLISCPCYLTAAGNFTHRCWCVAFEYNHVLLPVLSVWFILGDKWTSWGSHQTLIRLNRSYLKITIFLEHCWRAASNFTFSHTLLAVYLFFAMHYNAFSSTYGTTRVYYCQCFINYQQQEKNIFTHRNWAKHRNETLLPVHIK